MSRSALTQAFLFLGLLFAMGCASQRGGGYTKLLKAFEDIVPETDPGTMRGIDDDQIREVRKLTRKAIWRGEQDSLARIILAKPEARARQGWYAYLEDALAGMWMDRNVPIQMGATPRTIEALKAIASRGLERNSRVAAAIAISRVDPDMAKAVLLREYGDFTVDRISFSMPWFPLPVGRYLSRMGVFVPEEITTVREAKVMLTLENRQKLDSSRAEAAVNLYNRRPRSLVLAQEWHKLGHINRFTLLRQCWATAKAAKPEDHKGPGLFGAEDDDATAGPGLFEGDDKESGGSPNPSE